jgi:hypothetical protein
MRQRFALRLEKETLMGLFTNPCINPACDNRVRKGSQFCNKCGAAAPKGLTTCGRCGAEVRTSSVHCWKCGVDLASVARPLVLGGRWARQPEDFAARMDNHDLRKSLSPALVVEHGTRALIFQGGRFVGELREGSYDAGGIIKRLLGLALPQPATVILMDAADVTIDLENDRLRTQDGIEVGATERLVLRVSNPDAVFLNALKSRNALSLGDLEGQLAQEVQMLLAGIVGTFPVQELFANLRVREQIETALRSHLTPTLARLGLELVQLRFISFVGEAWDRIQARRAEQREAELAADVTADRAKLNQRLRETLTQDRMDAFTSQKDLEDFIRQTEHAMGLKVVVRQDEMDRLKERFAFERDREGLLRRLEVQGIADADRREREWKDLLAEERRRDETHGNALRRNLASAQNDAERRKIQIELTKLEHQEEMRQAEAGVVMLGRVKEMERAERAHEVELEAQRLEARSKATAEALISITSGPAGQQIAELERLRRQQSMSPEQVLALTAAASPEAARALAAKYQAEGQVSAQRAEQWQKQIADERQMSRDHADRLERVMQTALAQMGSVAGTRARPADAATTVLVGGAAKCHQCQRPLEAGSVFCSQCGTKQ